MKTAVLIPARGGSKGVPGKNIIPVGGLPLVGWTVARAKTFRERYPAGQVTVFVSSDCPQILDVASAYDVDAVMLHRHPALAQDDTSTEDVITDFWEAREQFDGLILLQPTSPVRNRDLIRDCYEHLRADDVDSVVTVRESNPHLLDSEGVKLFDIRHPRQLRPDPQRVYHDAGNVYGMKRDEYFLNEDRISGKTKMVEVTKYEALEVDSTGDLALINAALTYLDQELP